MEEKKILIGDLIKKIDEIYINISQCNIDVAYIELKDIMPLINSIFTELINVIIKLKTLGIEVSEEVVIQQLKNLLEAYEYRDSMLLADTLLYEIKDTLIFYLEIMQELEKENIML